MLVGEAVGVKGARFFQNREAGVVEIEEFSAELRSQSGAPPTDEVTAELGDLLFSLVNLSRFLKVNPEEALRLSTNRFVERFTLVESQAAEQQRALATMSPAELDALWEEAKRRLRRTNPPLPSPTTTKDAAHE